MAADDHLGGQFELRYHSEDPVGWSDRFHLVTAHAGDEQVGKLVWTEQEIGNVEVAEAHRHKGLATAMFRHAQRLAGPGDKIPRPRHSDHLTPEGKAWAESVSGPLNDD